MSEKRSSDEAAAPGEAPSAEKPPKKKPKKNFKCPGLRASKEPPNAGWEEHWSVFSSEVLGVGNVIGVLDAEGKLIKLDDCDFAHGCQAWRQKGVKGQGEGELCVLYVCWVAGHVGLGDVCRCALRGLGESLYQESEIRISILARGFKPRSSTVLSLVLALLSGVMA